MNISSLFYQNEQLLLYVLCLYLRVIGTLFLLSAGSTLIGLKFGFLLRIYTWLLLRLFEWGTHYATIYEEEEERQLEAKAVTPRNKVRLTVKDRLIHADAVDALKQKLAKNSLRVENGKNEFSCLRLIVDDISDYLKAGFETVVEDEMSTAFEKEELPCWNLLSRTRRAYPYMRWRLRGLWIFGFLFRYFILLPVRFALLVFGLLFLGSSTVFVRALPHDYRFRKQLASYSSVVSFRLLGKSASLLARYHNIQNRPKPGGICVANHTSPFDICVLNADSVYALTGQLHGGMLGYMEHALSRLTPHLWFERANQTDRSYVLDSMRNHLKDHAKPPILIFPEGVCVNNTAVVLFRKGSFEAATTIYPVAIRYDAKFCDAFWYQDTWIGHLYDLLTSWAIVCDVWFLPAMHRTDAVNAVDFADEVKGAISEEAGLRHLIWDGRMKQYIVKAEETIENERRRYSEHLKQNVGMYYD